MNYGLQKLAQAAIDESFPLSCSRYTFLFKLKRMHQLFFFIKLVFLCGYMFV